MRKAGCLCAAAVESRCCVEAVERFRVTFSIFALSRGRTFEDFGSSMAGIFIRDAAFRGLLDTGSDSTLIEPPSQPLPASR